MVGRRGPAVLRGIGAALVAGVISALVARLIMRAVTLVVGGQPSFSLLGTAMICVFFVVPMLPGAIALALSGRRWPYLLLVAGVGLLVSQAAAIGSQDLGHIGVLSPGKWTLLVLCAAAMFGGIVAQAVFVARAARRRATASAVLAAG